MHPYPHLYVADARGGATAAVAVGSPGLPVIQTTAPPQFGGPEGNWSPETLLVAAIANCLILTFRAVSRAAKVDWHRLECRVEGTLDRVEGVAQFTRFATSAKLSVPPGADVARVRNLLEKSEHACLVSNSLKGARTLEVSIIEETVSPAATP